MMTADDVVELHARCRQQEIDFWINGGWGVDALLGEQTRAHEDLDIVIEAKHVTNLRCLLEMQGYRDVPRPDTRPWNFVLGDDQGRQVDFHVIVLDDIGNGAYGETGWAYPAGSLTGTGTIIGHPVKCIAPEYVVKFRTGYKLRDRDYMDVPALCDRFCIEYPKEYAHVKNRTAEKPS